MPIHSGPPAARPPLRYEWPTGALSRRRRFLRFLVEIAEQNMTFP